MESISSVGDTSQPMPTKAIPAAATTATTAAGTAATPSATTTTTNATDDPNWWGNCLPSPTAPYDDNEDYGLFPGAVDDNTPIAELYEEIGPSAAATGTTAGTARHSTARTHHRWSVNEEFEFLAAHWDLDADIRRRTGQQGRSWYPLIQRELLACRPDWPRDISSIKVKFARLKEQWHRLRFEGNRSGAGRARNLPMWYNVAEDLWGEHPSTIPPVLACSGLLVAPDPANVPSHPATPAPAPAPRGTMTPAVIMPTAIPTTSQAPPANPAPPTPSPSLPRTPRPSPISPDTIQQTGDATAATDSVSGIFGAMVGVSMRGRRLTWGARAPSDGQEGCSRNAWYEFPNRRHDNNDKEGGRKDNGGVGRRSHAKKKKDAKPDAMRDLTTHLDERDDKSWAKFEKLTWAVAHSFQDDRRSSRRRDTPSTSSSDTEQ
ncbi:unnamed protein product [Closterium sp. NIES-53]